jgi:hypothetical protein
VRAWQAQGVRIAWVVAAAVLVGCTSVVELPAGSPSPTVSTKRTQGFEATFEPVDRIQHQVGPDLEKTYGWLEYSATTRFLDNSFDAQMQVANDFVKGNGTFEGFVTLESPEGDVGLRITGVAANGPQGPGTSFTGETEVIGGTDAYATLAGRGRFSGERTGDTGTPIDVQVTLELINAR